MALMPGTPCVVVASGGTPVSEAPSGFGTALTPSSKSFGIPVTIVVATASIGGTPVTFVGEDGTLWPGGVAPGGGGFPDNATSANEYLFLFI